MSIADALMSTMNRTVYQEIMVQDSVLSDSKNEISNIVKLMKRLYYNLPVPF